MLLLGGGAYQPFLSHLILRMQPLMLPGLGFSRILLNVRTAPSCYFDPSTLKPFFLILYNTEHYIYTLIERIKKSSKREVLWRFGYRLLFFFCSRDLEQRELSCILTAVNIIFSQKRRNKMFRINFCLFYWPQISVLLTNTPNQKTSFTVAAKETLFFWPLC